MSQYREERLESLLREELNKLLERYFEKPVGSLVTVTNIRISKDNSEAEVGISVIPEKMEPGVIKNLQGFAPELHHKLIRAMNIRTVPLLQFYLDRGTENAAKLEKLVMEHKEEFDGEIDKEKN